MRVRAGRAARCRIRARKKGTGMHRRGLRGFVLLATASALVCALLAACPAPASSGTDEGGGLRVAYDGNGHTGGMPPQDEGSYEPGMTVTVMGPDYMVKAGSTFAGWNTAPDGSGENRAVGSTFSIGDEDVTLYARWTANPTHGVIYEGNGATDGSAPVDGNRYESGMTVTVLDAGSLTYAGRTFVGWNTAYDGSGTDRAVGSSFVMGDEDVVLYARWTERPTYAVAYEGNGNTDGSAPVDYNRYEEGMPVLVMDGGSLGKTGFAFADWNTAEDGSGTPRAPGTMFAMGTEDVALYAQWTANPVFTVTYDGNGNTGGEAPVDGNRYEEGMYATALGPGTLTKSGATFASWNTAADGSGTDVDVGMTFAMAAYDVVLFARWTVNPVYAVSYHGNGSTGGTAPVDGARYEAGMSVTVMGAGSLLKAGSNFSGWNTDPYGTGTPREVGSSFTMGNEDVILYAQWEQIPQYVVTFNLNGGTRTGGGAVTQLVQSGNSAIAPYVYRNGYSFLQWDKPLGNIASDQTITAQWGAWAWSEKAVPGTGTGFDWADTAMSSAGTRIAAIGGASVFTSSDGGATWVQRTAAGSRAWRSIASSADGTKLFAAVNGGYVYASADGGATWVERTGSGSRSWNSICCSDDGTRIAATVSNGYIYTSSDGGASWTEQTGALYGTRYDIACSSDGMKLATRTGADIRTSADGGATWTVRIGLGSARGIASSSDGTRLAACNSYDYIYTSADGGATWTQRTGAGARNWADICSSANGAALVAVEYGGGVYASADFGATWSELSSAGGGTWKTIDCSSDGTRIACGKTSGYVAVSANGGLAWSESVIELDSRNWSGLASSADGARLLGAAGRNGNGYLYTSADSGTSWNERRGAGFRKWNAVASSSDGNRLVAVAGNKVDGSGGDYICVSSDGGSTWSERVSAGARHWISACSSGDGTKLAAAVGLSGYVYTSADGGSTWTERTGAGARDWAAIDCSGDGNRIVAADSDIAGIFVSNDGGATWAVNDVSGNYFESCSISDDGTTLVAGGQNCLFISTDGGETWRDSYPYSGWHAGIAMASDGSRIYALYGNNILSSVNKGLSWEMVSDPDEGWSCIASSADGKKLVIARPDFRNVYRGVLQ